MKVTRKQLWTYLNNQGEETYSGFLDCCGSRDHDVTAEVFNQLRNLCDDEVRKPIRQVIAGQYLSEDRPGGDDYVAVVDDVLSAIEEGYRIVTWYGPKTEVLIAGYLPDYLTVEG